MNSNELLLTARGTILAGNMGDHTDSNSHSQVVFMTSLLLWRAVCSAVSKMWIGREILSGCFPSKLPPLIFLISSYLHQGASGYQQPGPCRSQVHHEVERPPSAGASSRGGAGGLSKQRHLLPTEWSQARKCRQHFR